MTWMSPKHSQVEFFISAKFDGIDKVRRVDLPIDFIIGGSVNTIFMKHTIWNCQGIYLV